MSGPARLLRWLENKSDLLSAILVKEVRQVVRGREFVYSLGAGLLAGLAVAFFGAADALTGTGTAGRWTFSVLIGILTLIGLAVVPLGAFNALRTERAEQTLELMTLTALTPRRVVIGKLLAQGVKLATLFAAMAPFVAMSFLLGGIDFGTILLSLAVLLLWSLWVCAACLFLSSLLKSRAMMALVFGGAAILLLMLLSLSRMMFMILFSARGVGGVGAVSSGLGFSSGADFWWALAMMTTMVLATMANLVLLAEHRLSLATENRVTPLRIGFLVQFLLIVAWALSYITESPSDRSDVIDVLSVVGCLHLALVAIFTVTEDLVVPRRVLLDVRTSSRWRSLFGLLRPGGGYGALYVLAQMAILIVVAWQLGPTWRQLRWLFAACGFICFFTGVPAFAVRFLKPERRMAVRLRVGVLLLLPAAMILPDVIYYVLWRPDVLDLAYSGRHLINPIRTLSNWGTVEIAHWQFLPLVMGISGVVAYAALIFLGLTMITDVAPTDRRGSAVKAREHPSADVIY